MKNITNITVVSPKEDKNQWFICESISEAKNIHDAFDFDKARVKTFAAGEITPEELGFGEFEQVTDEIFRGMIESINEGENPFVF